MPGLVPGVKETRMDKAVPAWEGSQRHSICHKTATEEEERTQCRQAQRREEGKEGKRREGRKEERKERRNWLSFTFDLRSTG